MPIDAGRALLSWLVFAAPGLGGCGRAVYHDPLHDVIATADRIVVRDGGFNGPKPNDRQKVLFRHRSGESPPRVDRQPQVPPQADRPFVGLLGLSGHRLVPRLRGWPSPRSTLPGNPLERLPHRCFAHQGIGRLAETVAARARHQGRKADADNALAEWRDVRIRHC